MAELQPNEVLFINARASFVTLDEPESAVADGKKYYGFNLLFDPKTKDGRANIKKAEAAKKYCEAEAFKGAKGEIKYKEGRCDFLPGDECVSQTTGEVYNGYEGMMVVKCRLPDNKTPDVRNRKKEVIRPGDKQWPYSGCYVNAIVRFFCVSGTDKGGNGFFGQFATIQFWGDGEPFGSSIDVESHLPTFSDDEEDEDDGI